MRESWQSRWGLILAAAGNAIGIGNLLRFPGQAANNGGGAFILPYLISLVVFGLPMMWIAWTIGRYGGIRGHGTMPGIFDLMTRWRGAKYLGALAVGAPLIFCFYYTYLEAWCLAYAWFSLTGAYETAHLPTFLLEFQGVLPTSNYFSSVSTAFLFLLITVALNVWVLYRGVARGIELLAKIAMPALLVFCVLMVVRIFTLPDAKGSVIDGLAFVWNPNFSALGKPAVWLAAAGQIFFTLSIGFGALEVYASYLREHDDVALTGFTTAATNEFVEVIFGSLIAIPAAAVFFGVAQIPEIAGSGMFNIGMVSMPEILRSTHSAMVFGTIWFLLLFFAAFTSSVAVAQPVVAFLQDEGGLPRGVSAVVVALLWLFGSIPVVFFQRYGFIDELDFWAGTVGLVVISTIEVVLFAWVFGLKKGWAELHRGALMRVPTVFRFVMRYVTPIALILILTGWFYTDVIAGTRLTPKPALRTAIVDRKNLKGDFATSKPKNAEEHAQIEQAAKDAVEHAGRDLKAWATLDFDGIGGVTVLGIGGDPVLTAALPAEKVERMLELEHYQYLESGKPRPLQAELVIEGVYTRPYVWMARGMIAFSLLGFIAMVGVIWRQRRAAAADKPPEPASPGQPKVETGNALESEEKSA